MLFEANCRTTAMGSMPHKDINKAMELALSMDIPFWPQLPRITYYEDMFVQFSHDFPGVTIDESNERIVFHNDKFEDEFIYYSEVISKPEALAINQDISIAYHRFLEIDLAHYIAIRGHVTGPINLGFQIIDEDGKPIIYNEAIREILFEFIQRKANVQYRELKQKNENVFVWLDDPGFWWVFSSTTGYDDVKAKQDYIELLHGIEGPRALHMCVNVNLPYLFDLGIEILSIDIYQLDIIPKEYAKAIVEFLKHDGIICWGIVPTESATLNVETTETLNKRLITLWESISKNTGIHSEQIAAQALISPARCCLRNPEQTGPARNPSCNLFVAKDEQTIEEKLVERSFNITKEISDTLKIKYHL